MRDTTKRIGCLFVALVGFVLGAEVPKAVSADLLVSNPDRRAVSRYDGTTGAFLGHFVVRISPGPLVFGPDGNLYVIIGGSGVFRFNGTTGASMGAFATSNGLDFFTALVFGPDGNLYVATSSDSILRYDGTTGTFIDVFVTSQSGGLTGPQGLRFGPDGNLYVGSGNTAQVLRYHGSTGAFLDVFVPTASGGLYQPLDLVFGPDGNLYVVAVFGPRVPTLPPPTIGVGRYNGTTGAFIDLFAMPLPPDQLPIGLLFGPDGNLYVESQGLPSVVDRFNGTTGQFIDQFVPWQSGGLFHPLPRGMAFFPVSEAPDCSGAVASVSEVWPPNHGFVPVSVTGVTDPEGGPLSIRVTAVNQDEALEPNTCPDAVISGEAVRVRAERSGHGNGRVYSIAFVATDSQGGSCTGEVEVCVPHDQGAGHTCVKDELVANSLGPCNR
jgi:hypothetical protein